MLRANDERAAGDRADLPASRDEAILPLGILQVDLGVGVLPEEGHRQRAVALDREVVHPAEQTLRRRGQRAAIWPVEADAGAREAHCCPHEDDGVRTADDGEQIVSRDKVNHFVVHEEHACHHHEREHLRLRLVLEANDGGEDRVLE